MTKLRHDGAPFIVQTSIDKEVRVNTRSEYKPASEKSVKALDRELKEHHRLVLYEWGMYELTTNKYTANYNHSDLVLLVDVPDDQTVNCFGNITLWLSPSGPLQADFLQAKEKPTKAQLSALGWRKVDIGTTPERNVPVHGGLQATRMMYSLKHIGDFSADLTTS